MFEKGKNIPITFDVQFEEKDKCFQLKGQSEEDECFKLFFFCFVYRVIPDFLATVSRD